MKNVLFALLALLLCTGTASAQLIKGKAPVDAKYLAGGVPEVDGKVVFSRVLTLDSTLPADSLYNCLRRWVGAYYNNENVLKRQSLDTDPASRRIEAGIVEYLVFKSTSLVLDRTQIIYSLKLSLKGQKLSVSMSQISYYYEEERSPEKYTAEEWISDSQCLNKKGTKLTYGRGKFRIKTIDKFDDICQSLTDFVSALK